MIQVIITPHKTKLSTKENDNEKENKAYFYVVH